MCIRDSGYPFEPNFSGTLEGKTFLYRYADTPKELQDKYIEASTNQMCIRDSVSTIGFKSQRMDFNDYLYMSGSSASGPTQIGAGVSTYPFTSIRLSSNRASSFT